MENNGKSWPVILSQKNIPLQKMSLQEEQGIAFEATDVSNTVNDRTVQEFVVAQLCPIFCTL